MSSEPGPARAAAPELALPAPLPERAPPPLAQVRAPERARRRSPPLSWPSVAHAASLAGAFAFWAYIDRGLWFFGDEWDFLVNRGLRYSPANHHSIWFPHNEHWSTLPVLLWRGLFNIFHLSSYWPYLVPLLLAHLAVMHVAWRLCLRAGADPWISTAAIAFLGLLGAGAEDLAWAFQIGFVGSVLFGLVAIDLLDRPAAGGRLPDRAAAAALLASLMCSTLGDAMVVGTAVVAFTRLPVRRAALVVSPPAGLYLIWFATVGHLGLAEHSDRFPLATFTGIPSFVWSGFSSALGHAFNLEAAGAAVLVGIAAWVGLHMRGLLAGAPSLVALPLAVVAFYVLAALGRDATAATAAASRYTYVTIALMSPVMAKILSSLAPRPTARAIAVALFAFSAVGNVGQAQSWAQDRQVLTSEVKTDLAATGELLAAGATDVSGAGAAPVPYSPNLSVADIERLGLSHLLPTVKLLPVDLVNARSVLALGAWDGLEMTLTRAALVPGRFAYSRSEFASVRSLGDGCLAFSPEAASVGVRIWLRLRGPTASVALSLPAAPSGAVRYLAAFLVPPHAPSSSAAVELAVPASGRGYLNDNYPGAQLEVAWSGTPLVACSLARPRLAGGG